MEDIFGVEIEKIKKNENAEYAEEVKGQKDNDSVQAKYIVDTCRDVKMMKTFVKFSNRVRHPRATMNMLFLGAVFIALPNAFDGIKTIGIIISYVMGAILIFMALFRQNIGVASMKRNPEVKVNEKITYIFGSTGIRAEREDVMEYMGSYKKIYRVWEDEKHYYIGMNEEDLLVLPKANFRKGDMKSFRDFILDKSRADFRWEPTGISNIFKQKMLQWRLAQERREEQFAKKKK